MTDFFEYFEGSISAWHANSATITADTTHVLSGSKALKVVTNNVTAAEGVDRLAVHPPTSPSDMIPLTPNADMVLRVWLYGNGAGSVSVMFDRYDSSFNFLARNETNPVIPPAAWKEYVVRRVLGSTAAWGNIRIVTATQQSFTFWIDAVQLTTATQGEFGTGLFGVGPFGVGDTVYVGADLSPTYNIVGRVYADLTPTYELLPSGTVTAVGAVLSPTYSIAARVNTDLTPVYSLGFITPPTIAAAPIEEFDAEKLKSFAARVLDELSPVALNSTDLNHYIGGIGELFQEIEDYVGWDGLMDVDRIPEKGLPWLAQFVGVKLDYDNTEQGLRQQIRGHDRWGRGTPLSIIGPASKWIPNNSKLYMSERSPNPWHITFIMVDSPGPGQTYADVYDLWDSYHKVRASYATYESLYAGGRGDWAKVIELLEAAKPAGVQYSLINTSTTLYIALYILEPDYQAIYDDFLTYQALYAAPFPDINLDIPVYRQLVSVRYYRNIYNQFETYADIYNGFVQY